MRRVGHGLIVGLIVFLCINGFRDAPGNLSGAQDRWVHVVGALQVLSGFAGLAWLWGLWRGARWTLPMLALWALWLVALGAVATFAWDIFVWPAVLGAAGSLVVVSALVLWWARAVFRRRSTNSV